MTNFKIGDRVRVKPEYCDRFIQPWRDRFTKGRVGTVTQYPSANVRGYLVVWDHPPRAKYPSEWQIVMHESDLEHANAD